MVLKAGFFLSVGTAFGMYLAQEYQGMPNVKAFTTGLVSLLLGYMFSLYSCQLQRLELSASNCSSPKQRPSKRIFGKTKEKTTTESLWSYLAALPFGARGGCIGYTSCSVAAAFTGFQQSASIPPHTIVIAEEGGAVHPWPQSLANT